MKNIFLTSVACVLLFSCNKTHFQNSTTENNKLDSTQMKTAGQERYIVESENLNQLENDITNEGGNVVRPMAFAKALVVMAAPQSLNKLKNKYTNLKVTKDIVMMASPTDLDSSGRPGPGGGGGTSTPPPQTTPWGITRIKAREANQLTRGEGVKVCVVDTGVDQTHPDLVNNIVGGYNFVTIKGKTNPNNWNDDNGHGSHVSGIIAAEDNSFGTVGVAPKASLYGVKVLDQRGSGYLSDVADGISQCVQAGTQVINMSLGASGDPNQDSPLKAAILNAQAAGLIVVVAAGNEGQDISNTIPAGYSSVIAVSATDSSDQFASWSNFGLGNDDFAAPGVSIYSTWKGGGYNTISGTSMASPHVAGVAALYLSARSAGLKATDIGASMSQQGQGLIDALGSAQ